MNICATVGMFYVWSAQLDLPRLASPCLVLVVVRVLANVIVVAALLGQGYLCRKISTAQTYVMSFLCYTGRILRAQRWTGRAAAMWEVLPARVLCSVQFHLNLLKFHILF